MGRPTLGFGESALEIAAGELMSSGKEVASMISSISPVRDVQARISSRCGVGVSTLGHTRCGREAHESEGNRGSSSPAGTVQAVVGERAGGDQLSEVEKVAGVLRAAKGDEWIAFQVGRGGEVGHGPRQCRPFRGRRCPRWRAKISSPDR